MALVLSPLAVLSFTLEELLDTSRQLALQIWQWALIPPCRWQVERTTILQAITLDMLPTLATGILVLVQMHCVT
jgi:hypothetical protein